MKQHLYDWLLEHVEYLRRHAVHECIEWPFGVDGTGYGKVYNPEIKRMMVVHRIVYFAYYGGDRQDCQITRKCSNILCYNPLHLQQQTKIDRNTRRRRLRAMYTADGLCRCGRRLDGDKKECGHCRERSKPRHYSAEAGHRRNLKLKKLVMDHYGGKCACCGESTLEFLSIDHINGNGSEHRKQVMGNKNRAGNAFYGWLKRNTFPEGFQVLCFNCNMAKGFFGVCPHQLIK